MRYLTRCIEKPIAETLEISGVVVVAAPKFRGKSTTSKLFAKSSYALDSKAKIELAQSDPQSIL